MKTAYLGLFAVLFFLFLTLITWLVQELWNSCLVPAVDGVHDITFWQALGLSALSSILFKNVSVGGK